MNALTQLTEEERDFFQIVRDFAEKEVRPLVMKMDAAGQFEKSLIPKLFEILLIISFTF